MPGVLPARPDDSFVVHREVVHNDGRGADCSFDHNHHRRVLPWPDRRILATAVETPLLGGL